MIIPGSVTKKVLLEYEMRKALLSIPSNALYCNLVSSICNTIIS